MLFAMAAVLFTLFDFDSQFVLLRSLHSIVNLNFAPSKFENKVKNSNTTGLIGDRTIIIIIMEI